MPNNMPYDKWFWDDWFASTVMLSLSACGTWINLLGTMHQQDHAYSISGTMEQLARAGRCSVAEITAAIDELSRTKVADVTICNGNVPNCNAIVTVTCRRLKRESVERKKVLERVRKNRSLRICNGNVPDTRAFKPEPEPKRDTIVSGKSDNDDNGNGGKNPEPIPGVPAEDQTAAHLTLKLYMAYPKKYGMLDGQKAALATIRTLHAKGDPYEAIEKRLTAAVTRYSQAVSRWPPAEKRFVWTMKTFFEAGHYADDPDCWRRDTDSAASAGTPAPSAPPDQYTTLPDGTRVRRSVL